MNEDRIAGTARNIGGKVEEGVGRATGDIKEQVQGKLDETAGAAEDLYGQTAEVARDTAVTFEKWLRGPLRTSRGGSGCARHRLADRKDASAAIRLAVPRRSPGPGATVSPSMLWPLLCSALLVGMMVTGDVIRAYSRQRWLGRRTGPAASAPRAAWPAAHTGRGAGPRPSRAGAMAHTLEGLEGHWALTSRS